MADIISRNFNDNIEWMLDREVFDQLTKIWGKPEIDLMASCLNRQLNRYISWKPDAEVENVDAFSISWANIYTYCFSPFSLILRCVQKI